MFYVRLQIHKTNKNTHTHNHESEEETERENRISFHCKSFAAIKKELRIHTESGKRRHHKTNQINDAALPFANSNKIKIYNNNRS